MSATQWIYLALAVATLASAYGVVAASKLMHSALWLGAAFVGMAGIFVVLDADFLAAAQLLIYVGAVITMILFGIMLSDLRDLRASPEGPLWRRGLALLRNVRRGLLPILAAAGFTAALWALTREAPWPSTAPAPTTSPTVAIGRTLFSSYVIPFEVASVVLLVALVGAIVLGMREEATRR